MPALVLHLYSVCLSNGSSENPGVLGPNSSATHSRVSSKEAIFDTMYVKQSSEDLRARNTYSVRVYGCTKVE